MCGTSTTRTGKSGKPFPSLRKTDSILVEENSVCPSNFHSQDSQSFVPMGLIEPDPQDSELYATGSLYSRVWLENSPT